MDNSQFLVQFFHPYVNRKTLICLSPLSIKVSASTDSESKSRISSYPHTTFSTIIWLPQHLNATENL